MINNVMRGKASNNNQSDPISAFYKIIDHERL